MSLSRIVCAISLCIASGATVAQSYPERPITVVSGFAPGGNADVVLRLVAKHLTDKLGQSIIVENRPGANGLIAANAVINARPDGYTLLLVSGAYPTLAATSKSLPFDPVTGFSWVSNLITYPLVVAVGAQSPYRTLPDLIAAAKKSPDKINYSSAGVGSLFHLATAQFSQMADAPMVHIPYKGGAQVISELFSSTNIDVTFNTLSVVMPQAKGGKVRALAVTSPQRSPVYPDIPAVAETIPGYEAASFLGIAGPAKMSPDVVTVLNKAIAEVLSSQEVKQRFEELGGTPFPTTPAEMERYVDGEIQKWSKIVVDQKIEVQ